MSDESRPLGALPPADRTLLARAPLELAVLEVRFASPATAVSAETGLQIHERLAALGHPFPRLDEAQQGRLSVSVVPGADPVSQMEQTTVGWQLRTTDGSTQATVLPEALVLQTTRYERWSVTLRPVLQALCTAVQESLTPSVVSRIGLRYVDRFVEREATTVKDWQGRIDAALLGPVSHPILGVLVRSAQQQVELSFDDMHGALLRHGPFVDPAAGGAVSYLVDIDVFDLTPTRFSPSDVGDRAEVLNRTAATLFQSTLTREYLRSLQVATSPGADGGHA